MPISFPKFQEITDRIRADVAASLPGVDPTLENTLLNAIVTSTASRFADIYIDLVRLLRETFPQTATEEFLDQHGEVFGVTRLPATVAAGNIVINGTAGIAIPINTEFSSANGFLYTSSASVSVNNINVNITSLTRTGQTARATFTSDHNLASSISVTISGATQSEYNGTFVITVISKTEIEYTISGTPVTPATGSPALSANIAIIPVESQLTGFDKNQNSGARLNLTSSIVGVQSAGFADFEGITGGSDIETDEHYRVRIIDERSNLEALFDEAQIRQVVFTIAGVTRIKVKKITPDVGQVTILFVRDNDSGTIIPSAGEIADVKNALLDIIPAHTDPDDVIVLAPTPVTVNFTFTALSPDTPELRAAITSNLAAFFREEVDFEQTISQDKYRGVISTTVDPASGTTVNSFTLSTPSGNVSVSTNQIAVLGSVSFNV